MSRYQEFSDVLNHIRQAWERGQQAAFLMITEVRGSAYRRPGAKMMMAADREMHGLLSGGCLESDLFLGAEDAMSQKCPLTRNYNLSENDLWGLGIGCKGNLEILIANAEPADPFWRNVMEKMAENEPLSIVFEIPTGVRVLFDRFGHAWGDVQDLPAEVRERTLARAERRTNAEVMRVEEKRYVIDTVTPSERLIVAGAGHDAVPVVRLVHSVGFTVTVLDPRREFNDSRRFPDAAHLVAESSDAYSDELENAWWVIMNHHQTRDEDAIRLALNSHPKFIGVLGPLARTKEMLANIGRSITDGPFYAPVGLDLGAEGVDEVAVSIVSQLLAVRNNRRVSALHGKEKIHV